MERPASPAGDPVSRALEAWRTGRHADALTVLDDAVRAGDAAALQMLLQLSGQPDAPDGIEVHVFDSVVAAPPSPARNRHLAFLMAAGRGCTEDPAGAFALRIADVAAGDAGAVAELGLLALMAGYEDAAEGLLEQASAAGSGHAIAALLRLGAKRGQVSSLARQRAPALARAGHPLAAALMQAVKTLPDREAPALERPASAEIEAVGKVILDGVIPEGEMLSAEPRIAGFDACVPDAICDYLAAGAVPFLQPAQIFDPSTGQSRPDPYRTSLTASLPDGAMDLVLWALKRLMAGLSDADFEQGEALSVLVYRPGEEYLPHFDFLIEDGGMASAELARRGQRIATSLVRLNEEYQGGATRFPRLDIAWTGGRGDALSFHNADAGGRGDKRTLHAGEPVSAGMKVLASLWLRERP